MTDDPRFTQNTVVARRGQPQRFSFDHVTAEGRVVLRNLSSANKRFGRVVVSASEYVADFIVARTADQREADQATLLELVHTTGGLPETARPSDLKALRRAGLLTRDNTATALLDELV